MRVPISYALTYPERAATPGPAARLRVGTDARVPRSPTWRRSRCSRSPARRGSGRHVPVRLQRRERGRRAGVPRRPDRASSTSPPPSRRPRRDVDGAPAARPRRARRGRPPGALAELRCRPRRMSIFVAILGLGRAGPDPRGGPLLRRARRRDDARGSSTSASRRAIVEDDARAAIEYGIGAIPLGGYVKIPGMHRPAPGDLRHVPRPALAEAPQLLGRSSRRARARRRRHRAARDERCRARAAARRGSQPRRARKRRRGSQELEGRARRRTPTGARRPGSASSSSSRARHEPPLRDRALHRALHGRRRHRRRRARSTVVPRGTPAAAAGCSPATRSSRSRARA